MKANSSVIRNFRGFLKQLQIWNVNVCNKLIIWFLLHIVGFRNIETKYFKLMIY